MYLFIHNMLIINMLCLTMFRFYGNVDIMINKITPPLDKVTADAVDRATQDIVKTLSPSADQYEGFILGFVAAWQHFTDHESARQVKSYLDDTL